MKFYEIDGSKCIKTTHDRWGGKFEKTWRVFEGKIPHDYIVWNIGPNFEYLEAGWLPLCKIKKGSKFDIDSNTLATVYVGADLTPFIDHVVGIYGMCSLKRAKSYLKRCKLEHRKRIALQAVKVFQQIQKEA